MNPLVTLLVRTKLDCTTRAGAARQLAASLREYLALGASVSEAEGRRVSRAPRMIGLDEDMRDWSFFMICEHNAIVNRAVSANVRSLARNEPPPPEMARFSPKRDVMPGVGAGPEQLVALRESVESYLDDLEGLPRLRGTRTRPHPLFGEFDAHRWHGILGFHMNLHLRQARTVVRAARVASDQRG